MPRSIASRSTARKKKRSKTLSNRNWSSCDFAIVAASAARKCCSVVHGTASSAANASRISAVPTAMPSLRSSSANSSMRASKPSGPRSGSFPYRPVRLAGGRDATAQLHSHTLGHHVEVGAVLDDDRHRLLKHRLVDVVGTEQDQSARPVDRLSDRRWLLQVELTDHVDDLHQPPAQCLRKGGGVQPHDLELTLDVGVVEPQVEAAPLERLGQLAHVVRRED